jgi:hypothetical protein
MGLSFTIAAGPRQRSHSQVLSQIRDSPNLEGQVPVFISPRNRVVQLYLQALGSLFVASYDSQGYGGSIRPCIYTGFWFRSYECVEIYLHSPIHVYGIVHKYRGYIFTTASRLVCCPVGTGVKRPEHEPDHLLLCSAEVNNMWIYTSFPLTSLWRN